MPRPDKKPSSTSVGILRVFIGFLVGIVTAVFLFLAFGARLSGHAAKSSRAVLQTICGLDNSKNRLRVAFTIPILSDLNESSTTSYGWIDGAIVLGEMIDEAMKNSSAEIDRIALILPEIRRPRPILERFGWKIRECVLPYGVEDIRNKQYAEKVTIDGAVGLSEMIKAEVFNMVEYDRVVALENDMMIFRDISHLFELNVTLMYTKGTVTNEYVNGAPHIVKPNKEIYKAIWDLVLEGDFRDGSGWKGAGWGWVYGGRTIQGLYPYFIYEVLDPYDSLQIDRCIYNNQVSGQCDEEFRKCLNFGCWNTPFKAIYMMHYSICSKPWKCIRNSHPNHGLCRLFHAMWYTKTYEIEERLGVEVSKRCPDDRKYKWMNVYQ